LEKQYAFVLWEEGCDEPDQTKGWRIERRLTATSNFHTKIGRFEMVDSVLSAVPTFYMGKIKLPPTVIKYIDKYRNTVCEDVLISIKNPSF
jgi:hypothetical protein